MTGRIHQITEEVFDYFLEVLPPRWMRGPYFAFAEGADPLQLFWFRQRQESEDTEHFTRKLTDEEIDQFCKLSRIPRDYGGYYGSEFSLERVACAAGRSTGESPPCPCGQGSLVKCVALWHFPTRRNEWAKSALRV